MQERIPEECRYKRVMEIVVRQPDKIEDLGRLDKTDGFGRNLMEWRDNENVYYAHE